MESVGGLGTQEMITMRTITRKSYQATATHPQLGGTVRNLRYTEVVNRFEMLDTDEDMVTTWTPAESLVLFSSLHYER